MSKRRSRALGALGAVIALGIMGGLWRKTQSVDLDEHASYESTLAELRRLDRTLNQDVLQARFQLINSYDSLGRTTAELQQQQRALLRLPSFLSAEEQSALAREVAQYDALLDEKEERVERFKSKNAVLKNSLRYLPTLAREVAAFADADPQGSLGPDIRALLELVLVYNLSSDEAYAPEIHARLDSLTHSEDAVVLGRPLELFDAHLHTVMESKPEVDGLVQGLLGLPVVAAEDSAHNTYLQSYQRAEREAGRYRALLYAMTVGLIALVAWSFVRLRRARNALAAANAGLEEKVAARTADLDAKNQENRLVLDNVEQGLLTVSEDGTLAAERSAIVARWFPGGHAAARVWELVALLDPKAATWIEFGWGSLFDDVLPFEVCADQLPRRATNGVQHLTIEYRQVRAASGASRVLVVLTDVTSEVAREQAEAKSRDLLQLFTQLSRDREGLLSFLEEAGATVSRILQAEPPALARDLHTLKGNAGIYGASQLAARCHALEDLLAEQGGLSADELAPLGESWRDLQASLAPLLGEAQDTSLSAAELHELSAAIDAGAPREELQQILQRLFDEPAARPLARLGEQARGLARRLGKGELHIAVDAAGVRLPRAQWAPLWSSLVHLVRNAVDHGIEAPEERSAAGKPAGGALTLRAQQDTSGRTILSFRDDGRGIRWEVIDRKASALGLTVRGPDALFADGLSTKEETTDLSGRGVGMGAVHSAVSALGGQITVETTPGEGTCFYMLIPNSPRAERRAA